MPSNRDSSNYRSQKAVSQQNAQKDNTSDLINKYSRALDTSAEALRTAAKAFDNSTTKLNSDYKRTTDYLVQMMVKTAKAFDKDVKDLETSMKERSRDESSETSQLSKQNKNLVKSLDETYKGHLTGLQRYGGAFIKSVELVGSALLNRYKTAASNVLSSYESNLSAITVRMFDSNSEYTAAMQKATDQIRSLDLTKQFSQVDFTEQLATVLETGIRKSSNSQLDITSTVMSNLITNKLTPYISTNTRTYTRMTKLLGENFTQGMTGLATILEDKYGAEGLEQGQFDATLEAFGNMMQANAKQSGESTSKAISAAVEMNDRIANAMGSEESDRWRSLITEIAETGKSSDAVMLAAMQRAGVYNAADVSNAEKLQELTSTYYNMVRGSTSAAWGGQYSQAYGTSAQTIWAAQGAGSLKSLTDPLTKTYESLDTYFQKQESLTGGYGQSKSAQYEKGYENTVAKGVDTLADKMPHALDNLDLIHKVVSAWFAAWLLGGQGKGGKAIPLLSNAAVKSGSVLTKIPGVKSAVEAGTATLGGVATGVAGIGAGSIMAIIDAYQSGSRAATSGQGVGQTVLQGARGLVTGSPTAGMTEQQKKEYYQQQGYFSWKDFGLNVAKGGALGAGIGTATGGWALGTGTAVGAAVGAAAGALTNIIDQVADAHHYKELAEASEKASKQLNALESASAGYESTMKNTSNSLEDLDVISDQNAHTQEEVDKSLSNLKAQYPEYLSNVTDVSELDSSYITILKDKIKLEQLKAKQELVKSSETTSIDTKAMGEASKDSLDDTSKKFAMWASKWKSKGKDESWINEHAANWVTKYAGSSGKTSDEVLKSLYKSYGSGVVNRYQKKDEHGLSTGYGYEFDTGLGSTVGSYDYTSALTASQESVTTAKDQWNKIVGEFRGLRTDYLTEKNKKSPDYSTSQKLAGDIVSDIKDFKSGLNSVTKPLYENNWKKELSEGTDDSPSFNTIYKDIFNTKKVPSYNTGTDYVKSRHLAYVDPQEAVLTASSATKLRGLTNGSLSEFINLLATADNKVATATASAADSSSLESPIYTLLTTYTKSVTDSLSSLVSMVSQLVNTDDVDFPKSLRNSKLASYKGV